MYAIRSYYDEENIKASAEFLKKLNGRISIELLPYHSSATAKYKKLNMTYPGRDIPSSSPETIKRNRSILESYGLTVLP